MPRQDVLTPIPRYIVLTRCKSYIDVVPLEDPDRSDCVILEGPRYHRWRVRLSDIRKVSRIER